VGQYLQTIKARGISVLLIEQKLTIAMTISDRTLVMGHGSIVFQGTPETLRADNYVRKEWLEVTHWQGRGLTRLPLMCTRPVPVAGFAWRATRSRLAFFCPGHERGTKERSQAGRTLYNKNRTTVLFLISKEQQHDR
jgi:ABC-type proline/glycine betaine transport system ATPase subunit